MFEPRKLYYLTNRTLEGRLFLTPAARVNHIVGSTLARAVGRFGVRLYAAVFLANHYHLLIAAPPAAIPRFAQYLESVIARKVNRLIRRRGPFWERRYSAESVEDEASGDRLVEYVFAHGLKEGLVSEGRRWPGVHTIDALLGDRRLKFTWEDWTDRYHRELSGEAVADGDCTVTETLELAKLPWLAHLSNAEYRRRMATLYRSATRAAHTERAGKAVIGRRRVVSQHPHTKPRRVCRRQRPSCHASTRLARQAYRASYREFCAAYVAASTEFRCGRLDVGFPLHAFRPPAWLIDASPPLQRAA
jgi:REP element-mobilizing transposase RayT